MFFIFWRPVIEVRKFRECCAQSRSPSSYFAKLWKCARVLAPLSQLPALISSTPKAPCAKGGTRCPQRVDKRHCGFAAWFCALGECCHRSEPNGIFRRRRPPSFP